MKLMKAGLASIAGIVLAATTFASTGIIFNPKLKISSQSAIKQALKLAPVGLPKKQGSLIMHNMSQQTTVSSCKQYLHAKSKGYSPTNNAEQATASYFIQYCGSLQQLQYAKPVKYTQLTLQILQATWREVPSSLVFPNLFGSGPMGSIAKNNPDATMQKMSNDAVKISDSKQYAILTPMAIADFMHNGQAQILVNVANYMTQGSFHYYHNVLLQQNSNGSWHIEKLPTELR